MQYAKTIILTVLIFFCCNATASAYIGPGLGLTFLGELFMLMGGIFMALVMVLLWPLRLLVKKWKARTRHHD